MEIYKSQEHEIRYMARKHRIPESDLEAYVTKANRDIRSMFPDQTNEWKLFRAERQTWNHFFPSDKFPGGMPVESNFLLRSKQNNEICPSLVDKPRSSQQWVHDMYNPSQLEPSSQLREPRDIDSYCPVPHVRQPDFGSYKPPPTAPALYMPARKDLALSTPIGPSAYMSLNNLMLGKAKSIGVSADEYMMVHKRLNQQVQRALPKQGINPSWIDWKAESMIWSHFFGPGKFPNQEPAMGIIDTGPQSSMNVESAPDPPATGGYASCWRSIENRAIMNGILLTDVETYYKEQLRTANMCFPNRALAWIRWHTESSTWSHFFPGLQFVGQEPQAVEMGSTSYNLLAPRSALAPPNGSFQQQPSLVTRHTSSPPRHTSEVGLEFSLASYEHLEHVMEAKARRLGVRREFFQYLQKSRDKMRRGHPDCSKDVRNYLADRRTWEKFFASEPFPGIKPFAGHAVTCIKGTLQASKVSHPKPISGHSAPIGTSYQSSREASSSAVAPEKSLAGSWQYAGEAATASSQSFPLLPGFAFIIVTSDKRAPSLPIGKGTKSAETTFRVGKVIASKIGLAFERCNPKKVDDLEEKLKCKLEGSQSPEVALTIVIRPFRSSDVASFELAFRFVVGWVEACVGGNVQNLSSYADAFTTANDVGDSGLLTANFLCAPIGLLVNGKYIALDAAEFDRIRESFSKDLRKRVQLEEETNCRFDQVEFGKETAIRHLIAVTERGPRGPRLPKAGDISSGLLWHPQEGSAMNVFLEKWAIKVAGGMPGYQGPSIPVFWEEDKSRTVEAGNIRSAPELAANNDAGLPAGGGTMDLDELIAFSMEETAKIDAASSAPIGKNRGEILSAPIESLVLQNTEEVQKSSTDSAVRGEMALNSANLPVRNNAVAENTGGAEKRKLEDSLVLDELIEEGEIVENRAEKRVKFC